MHPDRNNSPGAHEDFVLLNEAYAYLQDLKTGKGQNQRTGGYWETVGRNQTRARAQQYAKMKYAEFIQSDFYKSVSSLDTIASHIGFFMAILLLVVFPVIATILYGLSGLGAGILLNLIALPMTLTAIRDSPPLSLRAFSESVLQIIQTKSFLITTLTIGNLLIILKFGLQTLISPWLLSLAFGSSIALTYLIKHKQKSRNKFRFYFNTFCMAPLFVNSLLLINFIFSFTPVNETYQFTNDRQGYGRVYDESTYIYLENDIYSEYPGIRIFMNYEKMRYRKHITYTLKKGILGWRVMTGFAFKP